MQKRRWMSALPRVTNASEILSGQGLRNHMNDAAAICWFYRHTDIRALINQVLGHDERVPAEGKSQESGAVRVHLLLVPVPDGDKEVLVVREL